MTKEEAQRLLQIVRDKEKARRDALLRASRSRPQPVRKDW
jgi:hypothetical protein